MRLAPSPAAPLQAAAGASEAGLDAGVVAEIAARLDGVRRDHGVAIPFAIESGSRAWGFPSPDSDYDCRFVFVRPHDAYLTLFPARDVIETPLTEVLDVNGWDVGKAIRLMLKGNAVILEWLMSPIAYRLEPAFRRSFLDLAEAIVDADRVGLHYLHLAYSMRGRTFADGAPVKLKKLFYVLRPCAALRFMRLHPDRRVAPMHFPTLLAGADLPADLIEIVDGLLAAEAASSEMGEGEVPAPLRAFIDAEIALAEPRLARLPPPSEADRQQADDTFRRLVDAWGPA
jgi:predicted nucleotidyltransferase